MELNNEGWAFLEHFEGVRREPYLDTKGIPTIGDGNTFYPDGRKVTMSDPPLTLNQLHVLAKSIEVKFDEAIIKSLPGVNLMQTQFNALVCLVWNIGPEAWVHSSVCKAILEGRPAETIKADWQMWRNPPVLAHRRNVEFHYFNTGIIDYNVNNETA